MSSKPPLDPVAPQAFGPTFISLSHSVFAGIELPTAKQNPYLIDSLRARLIQDFSVILMKEQKGTLSYNLAQGPKSGSWARASKELKFKFQGT